MHSRIYQISKMPINKEDYIQEFNYYEHWFTSEIADYVNGNTDRDDDIQWLKDCYQDRGLSFGVDDGGEYFIIEDKLKYFEGNFDSFTKALKELSELTFDDFISGKHGMSLYRLKESYNDEFGFYVDGDDYGCKTLDEFIRHTTIGAKYYIGATIDYHY